MSREIFISTNCLRGIQPLGIRLFEYEKYGLTDVELGAGVTTNHNISEVFTNHHKGKFLLHNYFPPPSDAFVLNLASNDEQIRQRSIDLVSNALVLCKKLNAPFYSVHAGFIYDPIGLGPSSLIFPSITSSTCGAERAFKRFVDTLMPLLDLAACLGLRILVENNVCTLEARGKLLMQTTNEFLQLFEILPHPALGLLLDTGHLKVSAKTLGFDPFEFADRLTPHIRAFHLHDNDGITDSHLPLPPGSWVLEILRRPEFKGLPLVLEAKVDTMSEAVDQISLLRAEID